MKSYFISMFLILSGWQALAQWQAQTLSPVSLYNNKTFVVDNLSSPDGIKVSVRSKNLGEPALRPIYIYPQIKCGKDQPYKSMDLAGFIQKAYPAKLQGIIGGQTKPYPSGVLHVCALENVNFDEDRLFITIFEPGSEDCDRSKVMDLIFPLSLFCEK